MQCASYIPMYYHPRDHNSASGSSWNPINVNTNNGEDRDYNNMLPPRTVDQHLGSDKEMIREIMQRHESIFRYQVQELHRVYQRQVELMNEVKMKEIFAKHLPSQPSTSMPCLSHNPSEISRTSHAPGWLLTGHAHSKLPELKVDKSQQSPNFVTENFPVHTTVSSGPLVRENSYSEVRFLSSRDEGNGKRILGLELQPDVYHDGEGKRFKEGNVSEMAEGASNATMKLFHVQPTSVSETGSVKTGDSNFDMNPKKINYLFDLNEPVLLDSLSSCSTSPFGTCSLQGPSNSGEVKPESAAPRHSGLLICDGSSDGVNSSVAFDLNSMPVNLPQIETTLGKLQPVIKESTVVLNCSSAHDHAVRKRKRVGGNSLVQAGTRDTDLEGPVSPENEEGSPPRGKSEDNQMEASLLSGKGEKTIPSELDVITAQTLVMISSSVVQENGNAATVKPHGDIKSCLDWFADIVTLAEDNPENKVMKLQIDATDNDQRALPLSGNDDAGVMTMKVSEEDDMKLSVAAQKENERGTLASRSTKGGVRGAKQQKDVGTEVLSKDLPPNEELLGTGSQRRNAGKKAACTKPRKDSQSSPSDTGKKSVSSNSKQPATRSKQGLLQDWAGRKERQGGRKRRAGKFPVIN